MTRVLTAGKKISRDLCEMDAPIDNIIEVDPTDVARRIDDIVAELERQLAEAMKENENVRRANLDCVDNFNELKADYDKATGKLAEARKDSERLDFIESHQEMHLTKHKKHWAFKAFTNYEYEAFPTLREAIDAAKGGE